jgi:hypothetical protein
VSPRTLIASFVALVTLAATARADGERVALCIGVNAYDHSALSPLEYAENDATEFASALRDAGYKTVLMTTAAGRETPRLAPTRKNIDAQLKAVLEGRKRDDVVVVAFAGHGLQFDSDPDCYFCPADAQPFKDRTASLVSLDFVYTQLGRCGAGGRLLLADCCRNDPDPARGRGQDDVLAKAPPKGVLALFACSPGQRAYEHKELRHGVFFHHVLEGLKEKVGNKNEEVEFEALALHARREVPQTVARLAGKEKRQTPNLKAADVSGLPIVLVTRSDAEIHKDLTGLRELMETQSLVTLLDASKTYLKDRAATRIDAWRKAAQRNSPVGLFLLGMCTQGGTGVAKDTQEGYRLVRAAADLGLPDAMLFAGVERLLQGKTAEERERGAAYLVGAAKAGDALAMAIYGGLQMTGFFSIKQDRTEGLRWLRKSADAGAVYGMMFIATCYRDGNGVPRDKDEALRWFQKAALKGSKQAGEEIQRLKNP